MEATVKKKQKRKKYHRRGGGILHDEASLAKILGEERRTVRSWWHKKLIPGYKLGHRSLRFSLDAVIDALARREVKAAGENRKERAS